MYARGILFGKMKYELGDHSFVRCPENDLAADLEFKTKGYFSGTYNAIGGIIKRESSGEVLYELSGLWSGEMHIKDMVTGQRELLFDATHAKHAVPKTRPMEEQSPRESQTLWHSTVLAVNARDHEKATDEKSKIEERQRVEAAKRAEDGLDWRPRLFRRVRAGPGESEEGEGDLDWILNSNMLVSNSPRPSVCLRDHRDGKDPKELTEQILAVAPILPGQKASPERYPIPPHPSSVSKGSDENNGVSSTEVASTQPPQPKTNNDLIDFSVSNENIKAVNASEKQNSTSRPAEITRTRSISLMDDDAGHMADMSSKMGQMGLMEPIKSPSSFVSATSPKPLGSATHQGKAQQRPDPVERFDTETSEVDAFFDAEG